MKKNYARQLILKIFMLWPKRNSYEEFDNEKKFLRLENSPPPPTFLMVCPLSLHIGVTIRNLQGER